MTENSIPPEIAKLSFEEALAKLEKIVRQLEDGQGKLDDAIKSYERGALLKRHCEDKLKQAQAKIDRIVEAADGAIGTEPLESESTGAEAGAEAGAGAEAEAEAED
ncbi:MAG: exodeoxyribonuclease VII small subunit [Proteobacteria bacterium]|nr:exodeoxyribonuclease VII small subunit [Pseudomonadota bacterium]